ncbi:hypothetical protein F190043G2_16820 [Blautia caecimuris]|uniref:hypothetical protein n=1 Tax=Blautia caecimuris TaxID=1796615 RepID=UPI0034B53A27
MINIEDVPGLETELQMVNTHIERLCRSNNKSIENAGLGAERKGKADTADFDTFMCEAQRESC